MRWHCRARICEFLSEPIMKKYLAVPFALLTASSAMAMYKVEKEVEVIVQVPSQAFYVEAEGAWDQSSQVLVYNPMQQRLQPLTKRYIAKSLSGGIQARLVQAPVITSDSDSIPLNVKVNGRTLSLVAQEVLSAADSSAQAYMPVQISADDGPYAPGHYSGFVNLIFETSL
ncbi:CS1 type fimbrial major subunit [Pseudomonas defluvii]|uniref:CS1 type fimbrial major subunit n=1 Tax=Pseudomonas defluvii TaxID=1876757 RepID=UPI003906C728